MSPKTVVPLLLDWFQHNARDLPWRRTRDPYAIWVSEIMLQQTQVDTVIPFWERWMRELPNIQSLASATPRKIHKLWEGLGYYTRVRNLQKAARAILQKHHGRFPTVYEEILDLQGIGRYTAGAICSIAFYQPRPILDGNVIRVLTRLYGIDGDPKEKSVNTRLWKLAEQFVLEAATLAKQRKQPPSASKRSTPIANRKSQVSNLNQSLMELGALVCTPRQPKCSLCPLVKQCLARKQNRVDLLPKIAPRPAVTQRRFVAFIVTHNGRVFVRQRPAGVVNAHLWEFPNIEVPNSDGDPKRAFGKAFGVTPLTVTRLCTLQHSITRYRIQLDVFEVSSSKGFRASNCRLLKFKDLQRLPFASAHKKILATLDTAQQ
jgi:A/G-specific adenine glycosylase